MKQLVVTPTPYKTESMWGYLIRVTECNGYETLTRLITYARGKPFKNLLMNAEDSDKFAKMLNKPLSQLQAISNYKECDKNTVVMKILDHQLSAMTTRSFLNFKRPKICPECVQENGFIDAFWDLELAVACPHHEKLPINACSHCGLVLSHFRPGLLECRCGKILEISKSVEEDITSLEMMGILEAKLHSRSLDSIKNFSGFPLEYLEKMPLQAFLHMIFAFARLKLDIKSVSKVPSGDIVKAACELLMNWPHGYHNFLGEFAQKKREKFGENISFSQCFVSLFMAIFSRSFSKDIQFVRQEYASYGLNNWSGVKTNAQIDPNGEGRFVSISEIERRFGPNRATLMKWAKKGDIELKVIRKGAVSRYVVDTTKFKLPSKNETGLVDRRAAASLVGMPVSIFETLIDSGHYIKANNPYKIKGYSIVDLENFRRRLIEQSALLDEGEPIPSQYISLEAILAKSLLVECKAHFLRDYLDGKLNSCGRTGDSYASVFFHQEDFNTYKLKSISQYHQKNGYTSIKRAGELIGTHDYGINSLINSGYIKTSNNRFRHKLDLQSVLNFSSEYVGLVRIANVHGTTTTYVSELCERFHIPTLKFDCKNGFSATFIPRSEFKKLSKLIIANPSRNQHFLKNKIPVGDKNETKVKQYIDLLRSTNQSLPMHRGAVNMTKLSKELKMHRGVNQSNKAVHFLLNEYLEEFRRRNGVEIKTSPVQRVRDYITIQKANNSQPHCFGRRLNKAELARNCGISASAVYVYPEIYKMVNDYQEYLEQSH